jgi:hypothetical protein
VHKSVVEGLIIDPAVRRELRWPYTKGGECCELELQGGSQRVKFRQAESLNGPRIPKFACDSE